MTSGSDITGGAPPRRTDAGTRTLVAFILIGGAVSLSLGVYAKVHTPTGRTLTTLGFPDLIHMKAWLATAALALAVVQVLTALRMYGRLGHGPSPRWVSLTHRASGVTAVVLTLPVAFHCAWSLGFATYSPPRARPLPPRVRLLRRLRHQDAHPAQPPRPLLGAPLARRHPRHDPPGPLAHVLAVVLHPHHNRLLRPRTSRRTVTTRTTDRSPSRPRPRPSGEPPPRASTRAAVR